MVLSRARVLQIDDFVAVPGLVVAALSLLAEHMPDVVDVVLFELVPTHLLGEFVLPEKSSFLH